MNIQLRNTSLVIGRQGREIDMASLFGKVAWFAIVLISIVYSIASSWEDLLSIESGVDRWVYIYLNFLSFVLGLSAAAIIFWRRSKSWMAYMTSLMLITYTATGNGFTFWYWLFTGVPPSVGVPNDAIPYSIALFINVFYVALQTTSLAFVLLAFPDGTMPSRMTRGFFKLMIASQIILIISIAGICLLDVFGQLGGELMWGTYRFLDQMKAVMFLILAIWPILRLRRITNPVQRQQIKWIVVSLTGMTLLGAIYTLLPFDAPTANLLTFLACLVFTYAFIVTLFMAILRYRLWDMGVLVNRALVYSSLTAILGILGFAGGALLQILAEQYFQSDSKLVGAFILLPLAAIFNPVKDGLQSWVDRYLKPEEIDFSSAIVEIAPDAQLMLSSQDILKILVRQTREQLNLSHAAIHLRGQDGQLTQAEPSAADPLAPQLSLDEKTRTRLELGEVVVPADGSPFSLYIPLVIKRASRPDFIGLLVFGPRNNGEGYSTPVIKSLCKLGCDAGKAIYLAQLREHLGQNVMQRLAAIERGLSTLRQSGESPSSGSNTSIFPA
ncbi:MAG TPA: hypothetical protein VGK56_09645 [Anaerolineales bacterium]